MEEEMLEKPKVREAPIKTRLTNDIIDEIASIDAGKVEAQKKEESELSTWNQKNLEIARKLGEKKSEEPPKEKPKYDLNLDKEPPKFAEPGSSLFEQLDDKMRPIPSTELHKKTHPDLYEKDEKQIAAEKIGKVGELVEKVTDEIVKETGINIVSGKEDTNSDIQIAKDLVEKMAADAGVTLKQNEVEDALFNAGIKKEEKAKRDLPEGNAIKSDVKLPTNREEIRKRMQELRDVPIEDLVQKHEMLTHKNPDSKREKRVELQVQKYEAQTAKTPIRRTFEQKQGLSDGYDFEEKTLENAVKPDSTKAKELPKEDLPVQDERSGKTVTGNYQIIGKIGEGKFGILYEAQAQITGKKIVLKTSNDSDFDKGNNHIIAEAMVHTSLNHPNIIPIEAVFFDDDKKAYAMMPKINGAKKLDVFEKRSLKGIAQIAKTLAEAYDHAHKKGIIHRDIKPDNILIDAKRKPYVIDFNTAKVINPQTIDMLRNSIGETSFTDINGAGTPKYMAPEILEGDAEPSSTTDVYSLGKVLYHMIMQTDKATPIGDVKQQVMEKTANLIDEQNNNNNNNNKSAIEKLANIVAKSTSDAQNRYNSMGELSRDLEDVINDLPEKIAQNIEEKLDPKDNKDNSVRYTIEKKRCYISAKVIRGVHGLSKEEFLMKASEFTTYLNNLLNCQGLEMRISSINDIELEHDTETQKETAITNSFKTVFDKFSAWQIAYREDENKKYNRFKIFFSVPGTKINGEIRYGVVWLNDRSTWGFETNINCTEVNTPENKGLIDSMKYLCSIFTKKQWFSPKKELEKKGFTLEYAIDLFDNNKFRSHDLSFDAGKQLFNAQGQCIGYAHRHRNSRFGHVESIIFKEGKVFKGTLANYTNHELIDLGDRYLLKPS